MFKANIRDLTVAKLKELFTQMLLFYTQLYDNLFIYEVILDLNNRFYFYCIKKSGPNIIFVFSERKKIIWV